MKYIAVSQRTTVVEEYAETRDALDQRIISLLARCQLLPLLIPNHLNTAVQLLNNTSIDGILLAAGNSSTERAETENFLIQYAIDNSKPCLGICHGMQTIQKFFGDKLTPVSGHISDHQVISYCNERITVNSYHDFGAYEANSNFEILAKSDDHVIKAINHKQFTIRGIMWHPERLSPIPDREIRFLKEFFGTLECTQLS